MKKNSSSVIGGADLAEALDKKGCGWFENRLALRPQEVSEAIGLSLPIVYSLIRSRKLSSVKVNNSYVLPISCLLKDLEKLCNEKEVEV